MKLEEISKEFNYTLNYILKGKIHNFIKNSIWKYLLGAFLLTYGLMSIYELEMDRAKGYFIVILLSELFLSMLSIIISTYIIYNRKKEDRLRVVFKENILKLVYLNDDREEEKTWDWIKSVNLSRSEYVIEINEKRQKFFFIDVKKFTVEEKETFDSWIKLNKKSKK